jgi:DNA-binding GntR family transcriptional regulator
LPTVVSARASLERAGRPDEVAGEHRELLAAISRGDGPLAGRIAADHARATANTADATINEERPDAENP